MVPAYFAQCTSAFTIGKMRCASASASALTAKVTKQPNRSIQITKPTSAAFLMLSAWEEEGEREKEDAYCLCLVRETRVVVLESGAGEVARVIPQFASHGQPPWGCIVPHWWRCLALCSDCFLIPARLLHWVCVQLLLWVWCVCVRVSPLCRLCFTSTSIITVFNCCFYYRISFTFSLVRSLRLAKLVGFSSPPPPLFLPPYPLPTVVHSVFPFSLSLFLSLFFCFCFYDFVLASVTCCLSTPALLPAHIFRRFPLRFSAWAAAAARHVCVCACSTVSSTIAHHIN